ncbi:flagellar hook-length control protein FliK [Trichococcus collinsii]|uniref:Hook-length control protein FliK n=1 Tax=Trichococcus collinsii TaxID=157076 RepID=A0AB38A0I7_9LACT|nr:flagellar hook-length control protein FliK [Trichococcus collinsii]CZQ90225.1 Hypothetical protein Tcol_979 [Trichococcus collinsii]SEA50823.1 hook-length control protein FliK [Trichococcus collinsii]
MITGASSGISEQVLNPTQSSASKADGLIFDNVLSGRIKSKEPATIIQEEPPVSAETEHSEENADQEAIEQGYLNLYPYRILQDGKAAISVRNVPTDEKADQTGAWLVSVEEKEQVITAKLAYSAPEIATPVRPEHVSTPESIGIREHGEKEFYPTAVEMRSQQVDFNLAEPENLYEQGSENNLISDAQVPADDLLKDTATLSREYKMKQTDRAFPIQESSPPDESLTNFPENSATVPHRIADGEDNRDQPEAAEKTPNLKENKAVVNQGPVIRELPTETVFGLKPSKVTASHIEDIQKTIEMQIEKTPLLGTTVVKILLTPDNIGDIRVQLIKTKDSITAVLHVQDAETKGLLEEQLPLLMEPFKHSVSESPLTLTVVTDPNLAFSFSEGADPGHRKMERQESRKRASKEKTETKQKPTTKQSSRGLSLLA